MGLFQKFFNRIYNLLFGRTFGISFYYFPNHKILIQQEKERHKASCLVINDYLFVSGQKSITYLMATYIIPHIR